MKRITLAAAAGVAVTATLLAATAASLGGLDSDDLGADSTVVAPCDTDGVTIAYDNTFDAGDYVVSSVVIGDVDVDCVGQEISVTLSDGTTFLAEATGTAVAGLNTLTFAVPGPSAELVTAAAVVITG